jgi:Copper amine oxidase N-terminal domain
VGIILRAHGLLLSTALAAGATLAIGGAALGQTMPAADFGSPPSGEIPILFNDHHVYSKPDRLRANRVLAAIVKDGTILVPLRSMFEQTGATVNYDPATKSVDVSKTGADVKVTLGKPVVTINGEDRPLDVPPEMYKGALVVPLRVISEGMGAYVLWVGDKHLVVVRYNPAPPPTPEPATPTPAPPVVTPAPPVVTPTPAPTATPYHYDKFLAVNYDIDPIVYNEISPGNRAKTSYTLKGGIEFPLLGADLALDADYRHLQYPHNSALGVLGCAAGSPGCATVNGHDPVYQFGASAGCPSVDQGCVTVVGFPALVSEIGLGQAYVPGFTATDDDLDAHLGFKVLDPRVFVGAGYYFKKYDYLGYPTVSGLGFGAEKLPDFENPFSFEGNVWYYPTVSGNYTYPTSVFLPANISGQTIKLTYSVLKYSVGAILDLGNTPLYLNAGYQGEHFTAKINAPASTSVASPFVGLGLHF